MRYDESILVVAQILFQLTKLFEFHYKFDFEFLS